MLEISHLNKKYGRFQAVSDLNLTIEDGELFGFVGHNGAGKTTTMKIVAGLLQATSGSVLIDGENAFEHPADTKRKLGYVPDFFGVYDNLKTMEYMEFYASMYGLNGKAARKACMDLLDLVNLSDKADVYVDSLSRGMKQRLCLARSLVHNPGLLLLDEPASGLDPRARFEMKEILKNLREMDKTIVISSHILPELADMCTTVGIMQKGRLIAHGTIEEIQMGAMHAQPLHVEVLGKKEEAVQILQEDPHSREISIRDKEIVVSYTGDELDAARLLSQLVSHKLMVGTFYREKGNLENLFLELTSENSAEKAFPDQSGNFPRTALNENGEEAGENT